MEHCSKCGVQITIQGYYESPDGSCICVNCYKKSSNTCYCAKCKVICEKPSMYKDKPYHQWCFEDLMEGEQLVLVFYEKELALNFEEV